MVYYAEFTPHGAGRELFLCRDREVLLEGPAGTGKSRCAAEYLNWVAETYPGVRILILRKTRASITESFGVTWEDEVLGSIAAGGRHPAVTGTASLENRRAYTYPYARTLVDGRIYEGRSHVVLGGLDKPGRVMSTQWDIVYVNECFELTEEEWQALTSRIRHWHIPWQQCIADTNPDHEFHWLNLRAEEPYEVPAELAHLLPPPRPGQKKMTRLLSRHRDNARYFDHARGDWNAEGAGYMATLHALTGVMRDRLLHGKWVTAEGLVWPEYDAAVHLVNQYSLDEDDKPRADGHPRDEHGELKLDWHFASIDWGYHPKPGCLQVWGVEKRTGRMYRLHEVYQTMRQKDWWAERVAEFDARYQLEAIACDPAEPASIDLFNDRMTDACNRLGRKVAVKANNDGKAGRDAVRYGLTGGTLPGARPLLHFVRDAQAFGPDPALKRNKKPVSLEQELVQYIWRRGDSGKPETLKEEPDPGCEDHACDALRYACMWAWKRDLTPRKPAPEWEGGTLGDLFGHDDLLPGVGHRPRALWLPRRAA